MSNLPYKNPISPIQEYGTPSLRNTELFGTHFSVYGVGGYMEVYNVSDLYYTIPSNTYGLIQYSGNTIPISFSKGSGTTFSLDTLNLNSDLISSGRRKLGMLVYVYETDQIYQFLIDNYDTLWSAATASTGTVVSNQFGTIVRANSSENQSFINAWTGNTVEGISGATRSTAVWKKLVTSSGGTVTGEYLPLSGGTVSGNTTFTSGLTVNYIDFDTTPNVPAPTGGTVYFDSTENALSYKPITPSNDVTVNLGQESLIRLYNNLGYQINNGQALHITGATSGAPTVSLAVGTGGDAVQFQISGIATHDIPNLSYGFMTVFGVVRDVNLTGFTVGEQVYLSQTVPGAFASYSELFFTGRTCEVGHVLDNSSSGKLQVTILNEIEGTIITTQENNILAANNSSTGIFNFSGLSITTPSGTTFNVGAVEGWIIDNVTAPANPTIQLIIYPGSTGNTALYVSSATETYILLTSGLTLIQQTTFPTPQQRRQNLYLGKFGHGNRQFLINAFNEPDSALSPVSQLRDMFTAVKLVNDGVLASANGANLNINTSAGVLYGLGIGYVTNKLNPNSLTINSQSPATFQYRTQTGGTAANTTLIEPGFYDNNGVRTAISGVKATNQRIYLLQNGQIRVQYGQTEYNQLAAAVAALQNEVFVTFPNFRDNGILIGILSILSSCSDLTDTSKAQFFSVSKFGELIGAAGGTSTTTLQQAYNNSSEPEIVINSTLDGFSLKNGTGNADNVSQLLQGINSGGTVTSFIRADGAFSGTSIFGTGLTATTVSATTYDNLPGSSSSNCFTTFYTTNISGCSPVNILSPLNVTDGLSVTGTSTFTSGLSASTFSAGTYQNLPSFNSVRINGTTQFSGNTNNYINFSGINMTITSAATNTLVFSAGDYLPTSGGTINGNLTITGNTTISGLTASQIVATDANDTLVSLDTATYPSLTELSYVKGLTASTQTQLNNKTDYFTIVCNAGGTNLADATTYYMGQGGYAVSTIVNTRNVYVPFTSTLTNVTIATGSAVVATTENTTVIFRLNNTTDTTLSSTIKFSGGNAQSNGAILAYNITGLSIAVSAGDFFEIKFTTPTWVTNPTSASLTIHLYFRR